MGVFVEITKWFLTIVAIINFLCAIHIIIEEEEECLSWKESALSHLITFIIALILALGLWMGW